MADFHWPPLESNPEIFTEYMTKMGMSDKWAFGELFGFDEDLLAFLPQPVLAVIVNMERLQKGNDKARGDMETACSYYMKQTNKLDNACGVIACLHAIYNNPKQVELTEGKPLANYLSTVKDQSAADRATTLEGFTEFQEAHKSFAAEGQSNLAQTQSDVKHHFIAFVKNEKGQLVELDGTKQGPLVVSETCDDVLRGSIAVIQKRLADGEISESLSMMTLNAKGD